MSLQSLARTALAGIVAAQPSSVVAVIYSGQTAQGVNSSVSAASDATIFGEQGATTGSVWVSAADLSTPPSGESITVDGDEVFVVLTKLDPAGAVLRIDYSKQRRVEGVT